MNEEIYTTKQSKAVIDYVKEKYGDNLEFLWQKFPKNSIWRNKKNNKWYAAMLIIPKSKLGFASDEEVCIIDIRFDKNEALDFAESNDNVFPGYHMNKNNWITVILDGSMETEQIFELIDHSYELSLRR